MSFFSFFSLSVLIYLYFTWNIQKIKGKWLGLETEGEQGLRMETSGCWCVPRHLKGQGEGGGVRRSEEEYEAKANDEREKRRNRKEIGYKELGVRP